MVYTISQRNEAATTWILSRSLEEWLKPGCGCAHEFFVRDMRVGSIRWARDRMDSRGLIPIGKFYKRSRHFRDIYGGVSLFLIGLFLVGPLTSYITDTKRYSGKNLPTIKRRRGSKLGVRMQSMMFNLCAVAGRMSRGTLDEKAFVRSATSS